MQEEHPKDIGFFGTRNMGYMHQQLIEVLSYAMVLTVRPPPPPPPPSSGNPAHLPHIQPLVSHSPKCSHYWTVKGGHVWALSTGGCIPWTASLQSEVAKRAAAGDQRSSCTLTFARPEVFTHLGAASEQ